MLKAINKFINLSNKQHIALIISIAFFMLPIQIQALPSGARVAAGLASFNKNGNHLNITTSNKAIINYNSFNIAKKEGVRFIQPSSSSVVLNRVIKANNPSSILGSLNANGRVFLVNPAGIYFGANSKVNANSFLATTLNITNDNFLKGNYQFNKMKNYADSYIVQKGSISVSPEGFVVLTSPLLSSQGSIMAKAGHVILGATDNFYVEFDPSGLVRYDYKQNKITNDDKPVALPKEYANSIINSVVNTDTINKVIKIVKHGDTVSLEGARGSAFISSKLNTNAVNQNQAGKIEVKAQNNAFILNGANFQSNAKDNGNGGYISVFSKNLTYSDKGASYIAKGGSISGDGGFVEVSAKDKVVFDGSKVDLFGNGKKGTFLIDPNILDITSDVTLSNTNYTALADSSITLKNGVSITTNGGDIDFSAPSIFLLDNSRLDAGSGDITLQAISNTADVGSEASSQISLTGAYLKGNAITISAKANSQDHFDSTDSNNPVDPIEKALDFLSDIPTVPVGLSVARSKATVDVGSGTKIDGNSIDISTNANSEGSVLTIFTAVGVGYGESQAIAQTSIQNGATLQSSGDININSSATSDNKVQVYTTGLGQGRGSTANLSLAYAKTDTTSTAIIENGASVTTDATLNIDATTSKSITASATAGSYDDGTVGASVAIINSNSDTEANLGGTISANKIFIDAETDNNLIKTASSSAVGSGAVSGRVVGATNNVIDKVESYLSANIPSTNSKSGSSKPALSAAFSYANDATTTVADIADNALVNVGDTTDISAQNIYPIDVANGAKGVKTSATATIDSNDKDKKTFSVAGAVSVTKLDNSAKAYIGEGVTLNSKGDISLNSATSMPYEVTWGEITSVSDITDKVNSNIGVQNGFFTTWTQSNSQGTVAGAAGSVNYFHMSNDTESYIDKNAIINKDQNTFGKLSLSALTDLETMNLAGVFGWKVLGSSGKSGLGGSYLDIAYDDTTKAEARDGVYAKTKAISLSAKTDTKNISIAEAGTKSEKYGAAGSFSYLKTNDVTQASVNNAEIIVDRTSPEVQSLSLVSEDKAKLFNVSGGIIKSQNVGIGASVSINDIKRDTESNMQGTTFKNDGSMLISAKNKGEIDAYSLAASVTTAFGVEFSKDSMAGQYGIGVSGDVSLNGIDDTTTASLLNSTNLENENNAYDISLISKNTTNIKSYAGSVSFAASNKLSAGLAGSYSQNDINNKTTASIDSSKIYADKLTLDATTTGDIESYTASGSGSVSGGSSASIAGSVSINNIANEVYAEIINASDVASTSDVSLSATDTSTIKTIAGSAALGGKAGVGASFSKNNIDDTVHANIADSKVASGASLGVIATENAVIDSLAASLAAATGGMAASAAIVINNITNNVKAWLDSDTQGVSARSSIKIQANDNENIETKAGQLTASNNAGFGASVLYNTIANTIEAYINNSAVNADGNILVQASSDKTIDAKAAGGAVSGQLSGAGGVVINSIKDNTNSYISNSDVLSLNSLSLLANEKNKITAMAGILSVGSTLGIGGAVLTNIIENQIASYIDTNSNVKAKGGASVATLLADGSGNSVNTNGIDVLAFADEAIDSKVANVSGGGTAAVGASVSVNMIKDTTNSYIKNSHINEDNSDANSLQSLRVRAMNSNEVSAMAGGLAAGGTAGIGASSDISIIKNSTNAYIDGGFIYAKNLAQTTSQSFDRVNSTVVSGAGAGTAALAGSVAVVNVDNENHAYTLNSSIYSEGDLDISAADTTHLGTQKDGTQSGILAGSLAVGGAVGLGGSVVVTKVKQDVTAHADDSILNAKHTTSILANNIADFIVYAATADIGGYAGAGGAVTINTADTTAKAYTSASAADKMLINQDNDYKTSAQDVTVETGNYNSINSTPGAVGAGFVGASGSIDVDTIHNTSLAEIGANTKLNAGRNLLVRSVSDKRVYSNVAAGAGGVIGVAGAVSVANINTNIDSDSLSASDNTKDTTNTLINRSSVGDQMGDSTTATNTKVELDSETETNINGEFDDTASSHAETTYANIGDNSIVNVGAQAAVKTSDTSSINSLTGVVAGGVVGAGGSVSIANIGADTRAFIGKNTHIQSGSVLINSNLETKDNSVKSYTAAVGAVGLGAAVSELNINYENDAYSDAGADITTNNGDVNINASSDLSSNAARAYGAEAGAAAVGLVKSNLIQKGKTQAIAYGISSINSAGNILIQATHTATSSSSLSQAAAGGIVSGSGSLSKVSLTPTVLAFLGDGVTSTSTGDTSISALTSASISSEADGVNIGGISVGVSKAEAYWTPTITSQIGSNTDISANNLIMNAYENMDTSGNSVTRNIIKAEALSATGTLIGGSGSISQASSDANIKAIIWNTNSINAKKDISINSKAYSKTDASSNGYAYGVLAGGFTGSTSTNKAQVSTVIGTYNTLNSNANIQIGAYSRNEAVSNSYGGAGGLLSDGGTKATSNIEKNNAYIDIQGNSQLLAKNGDISVLAQGYVYAKSTSNIVTAGGITINESEANTNINQDIKVDIEKNTKLEANNINIASYVKYLNATSKGTSKTTAADSTSEAYSNTDVSSITNINIDTGSSLKGYATIKIKSSQNPDALFTNSQAYGEIKAGVTGTVKATAHNNPTIDSYINANQGSTFTTKNLNIETFAPGQNDNTYKIDAVAKANTVVNWVLTTVDEKVKEVSHWPIIGWIVKWVWKKVKKWVKTITHSDASSKTTGDYSSDSVLTMNGDIHQKTSPAQTLNVAADGTISTNGGDISASVSGDDIVVDDLINHDVGAITLQSNGGIAGHSNIYLDNKYPSININNNSNKNLQINNINTVSDNANKPNIETLYGTTNTYSSDFYAESPTHLLDITNNGSGNVVFNGVINNYGGDATLFNQYGNIFANSGALIKTKTIDINAYRGTIGSDTAAVEVELQKSDTTNPSLTSNSFYDTYLGLKLGEFSDTLEPTSYLIDGVNLDTIKADGKVNLALRTANVYNKDADTGDVTVTAALSKYYINTIDATGDVNINGDDGVSLVLNGTLKSGQADTNIQFDPVINPDSAQMRYIDSTSGDSIYMNPLTQAGGHITVGLTDGTLTGTGTMNILDGYTHINIKNLNTKNINLQNIDTNNRIDGGFYINGVKQPFGNFNDITLNTIGYDSGFIGVQSNSGGQIQLGGDILNQSGSVNMTGNNGIYNMAQNLINSKDMMLDSSAGGDVGTASNPIYVSGVVSAKSASKVYLYGPTKLTLDSINAKNAYLSSNGAIKGVDTTKPNITANSVALDAQGDINSIANNFLTLSADTIAANSVNGEIKLNNNKDSVIGSVGTTTGLHAANNIAFTSAGTLHQVKGANIHSDSSDVTLTSVGDMSIDHVKAPNKVTLTSQNGAITQDGDSADDIVSHELLIQAKNGIGDNGISEKYLDTRVNVIDAKNNSANDIAIKNSQSLSANDINFDGYALYNAGGDIKLIVNGAFTQQSKTTIETPNDLSIDAKNNIFVSYLKANNIFLNSREGSILGDSAVHTNIKADNNLIMYALNGKVGTPANPLHIIKPKGGTIIKAKKAKNLISVYVFSDALPTNFNVDQDLAIFNNRPISGSLIDIYNSILSDIFHNPIHSNTGSFIGFNNLSSSLQNKNANIVFEQ